MKKWFLYIICYLLGGISFWGTQAIWRRYDTPEVSRNINVAPLSLLYFMRYNFSALTCYEMIPHISEEKPYNHYDVYDFSALLEKKAFQKMACEAQELSQLRGCSMELWLPALGRIPLNQRQWDNEQMFRFVMQNCKKIRSLVLTVSNEDLHLIAKYFPHLEALTLTELAVYDDPWSPESKQQLLLSLKSLRELKDLKYMMVVSTVPMCTEEEFREALGNPNIQIYWGTRDM